jgi:hypothetical protein
MTLSVRFAIKSYDMLYLRPTRKEHGADPLILSGAQRKDVLLV